MATVAVRLEDYASRITKDRSTDRRQTCFGEIPSEIDAFRSRIHIVTAHGAREAMPRVLRSRIAAICAIALAVGESAYFSTPLSPPYGPPEPTSRQVLAWIGNHHQALLLQFVIGYLGTLFAVLVGLLVSLTGRRGSLAAFGYVGGTVYMALAWSAFGAYQGTWSLVAQRGESGSAVVTAFSMAEPWTHAGLVPFGLAVACVSVLSLQSGALPRWLCWLGLVLAAEHAITNLIFALGVPVRPADIALEYIWLIGVGVTLLVRPVRMIPFPTERT